jgi:hypothetical protein
MEDEVPRCLAVQLVHAFQDALFLIYYLRLSPNFVLLINTPETSLSQIKLL